MILYLVFLFTSFLKPYTLASLIKRLYDIMS